MQEKTIGELINEGSKILKEQEIDTARLDAELLLGYILNNDRIYLITHREEVIEDSKCQKYFELIEKRRKRMPVKYILNQCEFMGIEFYVEEGVLIPRGDTEILVDEVLKRINNKEKIEVCDLCSGSGAIGISLAKFKENITVDAVDLYPIPEKVTLINIQKNDLTDRVKFIKSDLLEEVIKLNKKYDIIVSNPPYIEEEEIEKLMDDVQKYEPHTALSGGIDGLDFYRKIIEESHSVLKENGILAFEIGYNQGKEVKELMQKSNYNDIKIIKDLAGLDRVVIGTLEK